MDLILKNVTKSFGEKLVLDDFSYTFTEGSTTCILGKSGIGKTTLLRIIMGLDTADEGSVEGLLGRKISCVFQEDRLCENLSVLLNLKMVTDISKKYSDEDLSHILNEAGLKGIGRMPVSDLSGGMARRVAIVRALVADYDVLIMDEPLRGLDEISYLKMVELIKKMTKDKTVIIVTHDKNEVDLFDATFVEIE